MMGNEYKVLKPISYGAEGHRRRGGTVKDLPTQAVPFLLERGAIELVPEGERAGDNSEPGDSGEGSDE